MSRFLYLFNIETGNEAGHVDVSEMSEPDIDRLEWEMWAKIDEPWCVRDSTNDTGGKPVKPRRRRALRI